MSARDQPLVRRGPGALPRAHDGRGRTDPDRGDRLPAAAGRPARSRHAADDRAARPDPVERQAKLRGDIYPALAPPGDDPAGLLVAPAIQFVMRSIARYISIEGSTDFSRVEWGALAWINNFGAIPLLQLISVMDRDKSQVG